MGLSPKADRCLPVVFLETTQEQRYWYPENSTSACSTKRRCIAAKRYRSGRFGPCTCFQQLEPIRNGCVSVLAHGEWQWGLESKQLLLTLLTCQVLKENKGERAHRFEKAPICLALRISDLQHGVLQSSSHMQPERLLENHWLPKPARGTATQWEWCIGM